MQKRRMQRAARAAGGPASLGGTANSTTLLWARRLMMSDYKVELVNDNINEMYVEFRGPAGSPYEGGLWKVRVELPEVRPRGARTSATLSDAVRKYVRDGTRVVFVQAYPYKSPSIGFGNKIYHPNVDEGGGSVCLDVINHTWSPMFDLINVFETFLPQASGYEGVVGQRRRCAVAAVGCIYPAARAWQSASCAARLLHPCAAS